MSETKEKENEMEIQEKITGEEKQVSNLEQESHNLFLKEILEKKDDTNTKKELEEDKDQF